MIYYGHPDQSKAYDLSYLVREYRARETCRIFLLNVLSGWILIINNVPVNPSIVNTSAHTSTLYRCSVLLHPDHQMREVLFRIPVKPNQTPTTHFLKPKIHYSYGASYIPQERGSAASFLHGRKMLLSRCPFVKWWDSLARMRQFNSPTSDIWTTVAGLIRFSYGGVTWWQYMPP